MKYYTNFDEYGFRQSVEKALIKVQAILGREKHPRLALDDEEHDDYNDKYTLAEFMTNTSIAAQLTVLEQLGLSSSLSSSFDPNNTKDKDNANNNIDNNSMLATLLQWVHDEKETVTLQFQAEDGCSFLKEQEVELSNPNPVEIVNETTTTTQQSNNVTSSFFGGSSSNHTTSLFERNKQRVVTKVKEYHWKVHVSYKLKAYKGHPSKTTTTTTTSTSTSAQQQPQNQESNQTNSNSSTTELVLQSRHASRILVTSGGQATHTIRRGPGAGTQKPVPPIAETTIHPPAEVSLTWFLQNLQQQQKQQQPSKDGKQPEQHDDDVSTDTSASTATKPSGNATTTTPNENTNSNNNSNNVVSQFAIDRNVMSCRTPRRNDDIQNALEFHQSLIQWILSVLNFFLDRLEKEILAKHNPADSTSTTHSGPHNNTNNNSNRLDVNTKCQMVGLEKDPSFNHKHVVVREYLPSVDRYRVEPLHPSDGLPPSLTIKRGNLKRDLSAASSSSSAASANSSASASTSSISGPRLSRVTVEDVFVPTLPIFLNGKTLSLPDANALLRGQAQSLQQAFERQIAKVFPPRQVAKLATQAEAKILLLCTHWLKLIEHYQNGMDSMEHWLRQQLVQAIGKEVQADDFNAFVRFYLTKRLFAPNYAPKPFTYAVRRPQQAPDGTISIEPTTQSINVTPWTATSGSSRKGGGGPPPAIQTMVRHVPGGPEQPSIFLPINASTSIEITGDRYLHGWMQHQFEHNSTPPTPGDPMTNNNHCEYQLVARARQFSSFVLVVGTLAGRDTLDPKAAIVLQNKDEVLIPLLTHVLPSSQEFKDAIATLSPQQQNFCRAFRSMQLESSVFGICIIQLKPQLEQLLGLPNKSLTKEIQLTQDLMSLFVEYQIPSDLLSYGEEDEDDGENELEYDDDGDNNAAEMKEKQRRQSVSTHPKGRTARQKLAAVKAHVKNVVTVIESEKEKQFADEERKAEMRKEMNNYGGGKGGKKKTTAIAEENEEEDEGEYDVKTLSSSMVGQASMTSRVVPPPEQHHRRLIESRPMMEMGATAVPTPMMAMAAMAKPKTSAQFPSHQAIRIAGSSESGIPPTNRETMTSSFPTTTTATTSKTASSSDAVDLASTDDVGQEDFTMVPKLLDDKLDKYDTDHALRSTILKAGPTWSRRRQENLLVTPQTMELDDDAVQRETNKAFDLLDALSRSGTLPIACSELHVIIAVSHCFENDVMGSVIQDNINPIEKVERSALLIGSTIHGQACDNLLANTEQEERLAKTFPSLFISEF